MTVTNKFLIEKYHITKEIQFSDCCTAQYRSCESFADISLTFKNHGIKLERHHFESSQGKSAADGLGAIVKQAASKAVTRRSTKIRNAAEFFNFCQENLTNVGDGVYPSHQAKYETADRHFFYIESTEINRERPMSKVQPVKETMTLHYTVGTENLYKIKVRKLSCFCKTCVWRLCL